MFVLYQHKYEKEPEVQKISLCSFSEKLNPPIISVSLENRSIKIHWKSPPTIGSGKSKCFLYQVKRTDCKVISFLVIHLMCKIQLP